MSIFGIGKVVAIVAGLTLAQTASATVVFDNGLPNTSNGFWINGSNETRDDFTLGSDATITSVTFYYQNFSGITGWNQDITYSFWDARVGGNVLATGAGQNVTPVDSGLPWCCGGGNAWTVDLTFRVVLAPWPERPIGSVCPVRQAVPIRGG